MQTEKGKHSNYKLNAILGIKYNYEDKYIHRMIQKIIKDLFS